MATANESTPLLSAPTPNHPTYSAPTATRISISNQEPPARIHFLDNLRATLTALLIFYHAAFLGARVSLSAPYHFKSAVLPLALLSALGGALLPPAFFLVSGAAAQYSVRGKGDRAFLVRRVWGTLLPVLVWEVCGRMAFVRVLEAVRWHGPIGGPVELSALLVGPRVYVIPLLTLDCAHFFLRALAARWPGLVPFAPTSRAGTVTALVLGSVIVSLTARFDARYGAPRYPFWAHDALERPAAGALAACVLAYVAGARLPLLDAEHHSTLRVRATALILCTTLFSLYAALGVAQARWPDLWSRIRPGTLTHSAPPPSPLYGAPLIFFAIWTAFASTLPALLFPALFARAPALRAPWGTWSRRTIVPVYVHMAFIALGVHLVWEWGAPMLHAAGGAAVGLLGSVGAAWGVGMLLGWVGRGLKWIWGRVRREFELRVRVRVGTHVAEVQAGEREGPAEGDRDRVFGGV